MATETILTVEEIIAIGHQASAIEGGENGYILPIAFARAIEQAVLQSSEIQAWKRDSERFNKIINMTREERKKTLFFECDKDVIKAVDTIYEIR